MRPPTHKAIFPAPNARILNRFTILIVTGESAYSP